MLFNFDILNFFWKEDRGFAPCSPSTTSPRPNDSLAPARSALSGLRCADSFRRFPSGSSPPLRGGEGDESTPRVLDWVVPLITFSSRNLFAPRAPRECHSHLQIAPKAFELFFGGKGVLDVAQVAVIGGEIGAAG